MSTRDDKAMVELAAAYPAWEFWTVPTAVGKAWRCARLRADHRTVLNARSSAGLAELLEAAADTGPLARGDRVELAGRLPDGYSTAALGAGDTGTVEVTDSLGTVHVRWDSGARVGIVAELANLVRRTASGAHGSPDEGTADPGTRTGGTT